MDANEIKAKMPSDDVTTAVSDLFKVLGDATRAKILFVLENATLCVSDIAECVEMMTCAVSHQLRILKQAKLVKSKREGKEVIYSLDDDHVSTLFSCALAHVEE